MKTSMPLSMSLLIISTIPGRGFAEGSGSGTSAEQAVGNVSKDLKLRFAFSGGLGFGNADVPVRTALSPVPESTLYNDSPVSGSYSSVSLLSLRTLESVLVPLSPTRDLVMGIGLDVQSRVQPKHSYEFQKRVPIDFEAYALALELGVRKRVWGLQSLEVLGGLDWVVSGKTAFTYRGKDSDLVLKEYSQEDKLGIASLRVALRGRYMVQFLDFLSAGAEFDGALGRYVVESRSEAMWTQTSTLRGVLAIDLD
jgi:hypothetical protein